MERHPFASLASTGLNWADGKDLLSIARNLRNTTEVISALIHAAPGSERVPLLHELQRVYIRLAVCDMASARSAELEIQKTEQRDSLCRIALEKMADMFDDVGDAETVFQAKGLMTAAKAFARLVLNENLNAWFEQGPYAGLGMVTKLVAPADQQTLLENSGALKDLCWNARAIPRGKTPADDDLQCQIFSRAFADRKAKLNPTTSFEL